MKRGQVTVYIIVGLIAFIAIGLTLYVNQEYVKSLFEQQAAKLTGIPQQIQPIDQYMESCTKEISSISLDAVLMQGGYADPDEYVEIGIVRVPYWYDNKDKSPNLKFIETQMKEYISLALPACIDEYAEEGEINLRDSDIKVDIKEEEIIFNIKPSLDIKLRDLTYMLNRNYNFNIASDAYGLFQSSKKIIEFTVKDPDTIDFILLNNLDYNVELINAGENQIVYSLSSDKNIIMFANKFIK